MPPRHAACGSWRSPISADFIVGATVSFTQVALDGTDVYWNESRPAERGRNVIVHARAGGGDDRFAAPFSARTRAHEYGGGAFALGDGVLWFVNDADQRIYRQVPGESPLPLTAAGPQRYADLVYDAPRSRLIAVCEDHSAAREPVNTLVAVPAHAQGRVQTLAGGADFYSSPSVSPDGRRLAWLSWNHPDMPWDATELWLAEITADGSVPAPRRIAGGTGESVFQPQFAPDGTLYFVSDRSDWWNLYRCRQGQSEAVIPRAAEVGLPQWVFGMSTYAFASPSDLVCALNERGMWQLARVDLACGAIRLAASPYTEITGLRAGGGRVYFMAGAATLAPAIVRWSLVDGAFAVLRSSSTATIDAAYLSQPEPLDFPTAGGATAHGFYYPPCNRDFAPRTDEKPPLLVLSHGGPTSAASSSLNLRLQYWTSRGFAVLDVNYRGSTGYGRRYRDALHGVWGIADVEDCVAGARHLVERGLVDGARLAIRGGSAGGYTTLCALTFHRVFAAGASHYGVSDLAALARDTHKFEARYLDRLVGPYPQEQARYRERSPIFHAERLSSPTIFFQGLDDKVVPPDQTERMVAALRDRGVAVAYVPFEGEAHGFRRAENIKRALEAELYFYSRIFGFTPAEAIEPVPIANLPDAM
jgi:dipeptidyl aminopeptidase/acylaminoacyl peptidase